MFSFNKRDPSFHAAVCGGAIQACLFIHRLMCDFHALTAPLRTLVRWMTDPRTRSWWSTTSLASVTSRMLRSWSHVASRGVSGTSSPTRSQRFPPRSSRRQVCVMHAYTHSLLHPISLLATTCRRCAMQPCAANFLSVLRVGHPLVATVPRGMHATVDDACPFPPL